MISYSDVKLVILLLHYLVCKEKVGDSFTSIPLASKKNSTDIVDIGDQSYLEERPRLTTGSDSSRIDNPELESKASESSQGYDEHNSYEKAVEMCNLWIVSAASESHFVSMVNLLFSAGKYARCGNFIVYDLGLSNQQRDTLNRTLVEKSNRLGNLNYVELRLFPFRKSVEHARLEARTYAWKVLAIDMVMRNTI